jgi:hypothetical protein
VWGSLAGLVGDIHGWLSPGRQNRRRVLGSGAVLGVGVGVVFAALGASIDSPPLHGRT